MSRGKTALIRVLGLAFVFLLASFGGQVTRASAATTKPLQTVTIAQPVNVIGDADLYMAIAKGIFKKHGLNVKLLNLNNPQSVQEGLQSGSLQFATYVSFNIAEADAKGATFQAILNTGRVPEQLCVSKTFASQNGITPQTPLKKMMEKMKGASMGVTGFGSPTIVPISYLINKELGVDPSTYIKIVNLGSLPAAQTAFEHGQIDVLVNSPPTCQSSNGVVLATFGTIPTVKPMEYSTVTATRAYLSSHQTVAREMAQAVIEGTKYVLAHPQETAQLLHNSYFPTQSTSSLKGQITGYLKSITVPSGRMTTQGWQAVNKALVLSKILTKTASPNEGVMWTNKYLAKAS